MRICAWTRPWVWSQLPALPVSGHEHRLGAELLYVVPCRRLARDPPTHQLLRQIRLRHPEDNSDPSEPLTLPHQTPDSNHNPTSKPPPAASVAQRNRCPLSIFYGNPYYAEVPEYSSLEQKFAWLAELGNVTSRDFVEVPVNDRHDWVNLTDGTFEQLLPVCTTKKTPDAAVQKHASGVKTNCDTYVYSFSRTDLISKVKNLIDAYEEAREFIAAGFTFEEVTENYRLESIKWTARLKNSLKQNIEIVFDESRIREVLYRPFTKLWLYEDDRILSSVKTISAMFPRDDDSVPPPPALLLPSQNNRDNCTVLANRYLSDLNCLGPNQGGARSLPRSRLNPRRS